MPSEQPARRSLYAEPEPPFQAPVGPITAPRSLQCWLANACRPECECALHTCTEAFSRLPTCYVDNSFTAILTHKSVVLGPERQQQGPKRARSKQITKKKNQGICSHGSGAEYAPRHQCRRALATFKPPIGCRHKSAQRRSPRLREIPGAARPWRNRSTELRSSHFSRAEDRNICTLSDILCACLLALLFATEQFQDLRVLPLATRASFVFERRRKNKPLQSCYPDHKVTAKAK